MPEQMGDIDQLRPAPAGAAPVPRVRKLPAKAAVGWIAHGWDDLGATGYRGAFYGVVFALMGLLISLVYAAQWQLTMALTAGFFLIGPFACTGLYELSRQREHGEGADLFATLTCWRRNPGGLALFAGILGLAMVFWAKASAALFAQYSITDSVSLQGIVAKLFALQNLDFLLAWGAAGLMFAALVFAISVVTIQLLIDRRIGAMKSIVTSLRVLLANPGPMVLWAALIVLFIGASMLL